MNEDSMIKKATRPIEKNRRTRSKPAKIRHLQKQQKLWMVSKMEWRKPGTTPGLAPSPFLQCTLVGPWSQSRGCCPWSCLAI
jgi:ribosomal protein L32E